MFKNRRPASRQAANASGKRSSSVSPAARRPRNSTVLALSSSSESACIWGSRSLIVATSGRIERIRRSLELPNIRTSPSETFSDKAVNASVVLSQSSVSTSIAAIPHAINLESDALSLLKARSYNRQWASVKRTGLPAAIPGPDDSTITMGRTFGVSSLRAGGSCFHSNRTRTAPRPRCEPRRRIPGVAECLPPFRVGEARALARASAAGNLGRAALGQSIRDPSKVAAVKSLHLAYTRFAGGSQSNDQPKDGWNADQHLR